MSLGTRIKSLRKALRLTQQALADKAKVSRIYIQALEGDRRTPSMKLLHVLAKSLNVTPSDLVSDAPQRAGKRFQLDEFLSRDFDAEVWYRVRKLSESELVFLSKVIDAAAEQWENKGVIKARPGRPRKKV